jgi:hypothetical protein
MSQQYINIGATPNDGLGDPIRTAFQKTNENFSQLFPLANVIAISGNGISVTGNISGNYFIGNGSQLTGITASANTGNVTFSDINIIGTGNLHLQPDPADTGSYLDVYLTSGPDIHIAKTDANVIIGSDTSANVTVGVNGNVTIQANIGTPYIWTFGTDGGLTLPGNFYIGSGEGSLAMASPDAVVILADQGNTNQVWLFGTDGTTTFPDSTIITGPVPLANITAEPGGRAFINDANLVAVGNFGVQVGNGGSNIVPVWSDGTDWYIG